MFNKIKGYVMYVNKIGNIYNLTDKLVKTLHIDDLKSFSVIDFESAEFYPGYLKVRVQISTKDNQSYTNVLTMDDFTCELNRVKSEVLTKALREFFKEQPGYKEALAEYEQRLAKMNASLNS